ncbi:hypothetical protein AAHE18_03G234600 [Arachis hypogaea]
MGCMDTIKLMKLMIEPENGNMLRGWYEGPITFALTYKYFPNKKDLFTSRRLRSSSIRAQTMTKSVGLMICLRVPQSHHHP